MACSCGPAQDTTTGKDGADQVARREAIYNGAYQNLDAAVMQRLLSDSYVITYTGQAAGKTKAQFVDELGQLRLVFPELRIIVDSSKVIPYQDLYIVQGIRTFNWRANGEPGTYRERFTNRWSREEGDWVMLATKIDPVR
ncbi:nuclear transport factor 2 family protein [Neolewinella litorea]|uniref:nuclear transport factor 2 family protein n=1 Tax=Neolewinella litorea TaxID=2562452 RepID=UPI0014560C05|nr:nuclear transport factor 2 family protein [Neolewinella litorea]